MTSRPSPESDGRVVEVVGPDKSPSVAYESEALGIDAEVGYDTVRAHAARDGDWWGGGVTRAPWRGSE